MTESQRNNAESQRKMPDREKVIAALEKACRDSVELPPFAGRIEITKEAIEEGILPFLREQEPVGVVKGIGYLYCGGCNVALAPLDWPKPWKFCPWCGKRVRWE